MSDVEKVCLKDLKNKYKKGIQIPEIQRDYVMGAGGKADKGVVDKLIALLDAIQSSCIQNKDFDLSCIITYCKDGDTDNSYLEIYDGQQRLTTLTLLVLFCLHREGIKESEDKCGWSDFSDWYNFRERPIANIIMEILTENNDCVSQDGCFNENCIEVRDFSSFSMKNLLKVFSDTKYKDITSTYLLEHVKFDRVEIGSQNEIEQFFMDLNSGLKLKEYELFKAKLVHRIGEVAKSKDQDPKTLEMFLSWPHRLDNEWLNTFMPFADFEHPAEEYEVAFIRYCFRQLCRCHGIGYKDELSILSPEMNNDDFCKMINDCFRIMNALSKVFFSWSMGEKSQVPQVVMFPWGNVDERLDADVCSQPELRYRYRYANESSTIFIAQRKPPHLNILDLRGAYWNISFEDNASQLYWVIQNILLNEGNNEEIDKDLIIWAYITTLDWQIDYQNEYIRLLKILLNHVFFSNTNALYECQKYGQYLFYSRYCVFNIPDYYGKHCIPAESEKTCEEKYQCIYNLVNYYWENEKKWDRILNRSDISKRLMKQILDDGVLVNDNKNQERDAVDFQGIIEKRLNFVNKYGTSYEIYCRNVENPCNGVLSSLDGTQTEKNYVALVDLYWPVLRRQEKFDNCFVLLKWNMDRCYEEYYHSNEGSLKSNDDLVKKYEVYYKDKGSSFDKKVVFWKAESNLLAAYRIIDRQGNSTKTYIKRGSDEGPWGYKYVYDSNNEKFKQDEETYE